MKTSHDGYAQPGIGLISVGWMGKLHSRAYQAIPLLYPELKIRPRFVHAADTAPDRTEYAREVLGYAKAGTDYRDVLADPDVDVVSICAPNMLHREIGVAAARAGKAGSPTCARHSSTATLPNPTAPCPGGSAATRPAAARSATS